MFIGFLIPLLHNLLTSSANLSTFRLLVQYLQMEEKYTFKSEIFINWKPLSTQKFALKLALKAKFHHFNEKHLTDDFNFLLHYPLKYYHNTFSSLSKAEIWFRRPYPTTTEIQYRYANIQPLFIGNDVGNHTVKRFDWSKQCLRVEVKRLFSSV